ncbi:MAG: hypothetical protein U5K00_15150 [Melioribacteraceae bacterium]|nr:hypothetical protein [Melioribacteraceae bacterium]
MYRTSPAIKLALIYFLAGSIWILLSDQLVNLLIPPEADLLFKINITKGLVFVLLTTLVIYIRQSHIPKENSRRNLRKRKDGRKAYQEREEI